ncbi:hypothetical protein HU200_012058 [Digitaria exilis]|uniref:ENTH domain-containing protein n=1 Tax=Digitaria exilis TaxID=1010633 RepID=A0A835FFL4_9POAL|nr:hypothetical protein HU200_012058 [Digitaria exilis]
MNVLRQRLGGARANWRHVYKTLSVIEYLLANGTERAVDDIIDNSSQIAKLVNFEYVEPNGKDAGLNVRKKAENVLAIVDDREKLQQVREKAAVTRDNLMDDLVDTTESTSRALPNVGIASLPEVDLFANTDFQSANAQLESATGSHAKISTQEDIDLFVGRSPFGKIMIPLLLRSPFAGSVSSDMEFLVRGSPNKSSEQNVASFTHSSATAFDSFQPSFVVSFPSDIEFSVRDTPSKTKNPRHQHSSAIDFDPFSAIPAKTLDGFDSFGTFSSNTAKKVDLSDVEVVGQLSDVSEDKGPAVPWFRGMTMDTGSGLQLQSMSGFPSSAGSMGGSGNFQQQQFGSFK